MFSCSKKGKIKRVKHKKYNIDTISRKFWPISNCAVIFYDSLRETRYTKNIPMHFKNHKIICEKNFLRISEEKFPKNLTLAGFEPTTNG
jgi:hypothetical protein